MAPVLAYVDKCRDVPAGLADACLVRMTKSLPTIVLTTDSDFRLYFAATATMSFLV